MRDCDRHPASAISGIRVGKYLLGRILSKNHSSTKIVRLAIDTENHRLVAIKILEKEWIKRCGTSSALRREIGILGEMRHPNVVKLLRVFNSPKHLFMAMEALEGRPLHREIRRLGRLHEDRSRHLFKQLMSAVEYIHSMGVAHGDIRAENLLLNKDGSRMKIAGFGRAVRVDVDVNGEDYVYRRRKAYSSSREHEKLLHAQHDHIGRTHAARPGGAGDASLASDMFDTRSEDIWCSGVVLLIMATGQLPFNDAEEPVGDDGASDISYAPGGLKPMLPHYLSRDLVDLLRNVLHEDSSKRLTIAEISSHAWTLIPWEQERINRSRPNSDWPARVSSFSSIGDTDGGKEGAAARASRADTRAPRHTRPQPPRASSSFAEGVDAAAAAATAAAEKAIKTARQAKRSAGRAAAEAREAESTAKFALAAALDEAALREPWRKRVDPVARTFMSQPCGVSREAAGPGGVAVESSYADGNSQVSPESAEAQLLLWSRSKGYGKEESVEWQEGGMESAIPRRALTLMERSAAAAGGDVVHQRGEGTRDTVRIENGNISTSGGRSDAFRRRASVYSSFDGSGVAATVTKPSVQQRFRSNVEFGDKTIITALKPSGDVRPALTKSFSLCASESTAKTGVTDDGSSRREDAQAQPRMVSNDYLREATVRTPSLTIDRTHSLSVERSSMKGGGLSEGVALPSSLLSTEQMISPTGATIASSVRTPSALSGIEGGMMNASEASRNSADWLVATSSSMSTPAWQRGASSVGRSMAFDIRVPSGTTTVVSSAWFADGARQGEGNARDKAPPSLSSEGDDLHPHPSHLGSEHQQLPAQPADSVNVEVVTEETPCGSPIRSSAIQSGEEHERSLDAPSSADIAAMVSQTQAATTGLLKGLERPMAFPDLPTSETSEERLDRVARTTRERRTEMGPGSASAVASDVELASPWACSPGPLMTSDQVARQVVASGVATTAASVEDSEDNSVKNSVEESGDALVEESAKVAVEESANVSVEESADVLTEESANVLVEESADVSIEESADVLTEESANVLVEESADVSVEESANVLVEESANVSVEESADVSVEESADVLTEESANVLVEESAKESVTESVGEFVEEPVEESVEEPVDESVEDSVEDSDEGFAVVVHVAEEFSTGPEGPSIGVKVAEAPTGYMEPPIEPQEERLGRLAEAATGRLAAHDESMEMSSDQYTSLLAMTAVEEVLQEPPPSLAPLVVTKAPTAYMELLIEPQEERLGRLAEAARRRREAGEESVEASMESNTPPPPAMAGLGGTPKHPPSLSTIVRGIDNATFDIDGTEVVAMNRPGSPTTELVEAGVEDQSVGSTDGTYEPSIPMEPEVLAERARQWLTSIEVQIEQDMNLSPLPQKMFADAVAAEDGPPRSATTSERCQSIRSPGGLVEPPAESQPSTVIDKHAEEVLATEVAGQLSEISVDTAKTNNGEFVDYVKENHDAAQATVVESSTEEAIDGAEPGYYGLVDASKQADAAAGGVGVKVGGAAKPGVGPGDALVSTKVTVTSASLPPVNTAEVRYTSAPRPHPKKLGSLKIHKSGSGSGGGGDGDDEMSTGHAESPKRARSSRRRRRFLSSRRSKSLTGERDSSSGGVDAGSAAAVVTPAAAAVKVPSAKNESEKDSKNKKKVSTAPADGVPGHVKENDAAIEMSVPIERISSGDGEGGTAGDRSSFNIRKLAAEENIWIKGGEGNVGSARRSQSVRDTVLDRMKRVRGRSEARGRNKEGENARSRSRSHPRSVSAAPRSRGGGFLGQPASDAARMGAKRETAGATSATHGSVTDVEDGDLPGSHSRNKRLGRVVTRMFGRRSSSKTA